MKGNYISHFNMRFFYTHQTTFDGHVSPDLVFCGGKRDEVRHETAQKSGSAARLAQAYRWEVGGGRKKASLHEASDEKEETRRRGASFNGELPGCPQRFSPKVCNKKIAGQEKAHRTEFVMRCTA